MELRGGTMAALRRENVAVAPIKKTNRAAFTSGPVGNGRAIFEI